MGFIGTIPESSLFTMKYLLDVILNISEDPFLFYIGRCRGFIWLDY